MTDLGALYRKLERATFLQREQIAEEVAREMPADQLGTLVRGLEHPHQGVRLGVIEILRRASHRPALRKLLEHARSHDGDDRVFAIRALAQLAQPGDDFLADPVRAWSRSGDPFIEAHASRLASILAPSRGPRHEPARQAAPPAEPRAEAPPGPSLDKLVVRLFSAVKGSERIALIEEIERRGPQALSAAAKLTFQKGNADLVAYMCRAVIRQASALPAPEKLLPVLEAARARLGKAPVAHAAIDDALLALGGVALSPALLSRLGELGGPQLEALARRLCERPPDEVALHAPKMADALAKHPELWPALGPALARAVPHVRESSRGDLRTLIDAVLDELRKGKPLPPVTVTSACAVLAHVAERGEPLPGHLRVALDRLVSVEAARALCALCARLATEEAAAALIAMLRDPLPEARRAAREALEAWRSPWIHIEGGEAPAIVPRYEDEAGQPLARRGDRLVAAASGEEYVLDARSRPVRGADTELGGCLCCSPPRALVRRRREGLRCPSSWESHLREGGRTLLERDHALGRCKRCDSGRPRVRDGARVICIDCGAGMATDEGFAPPPPQQPAAPSEHGRADHDALPDPPTPEDLEHMAPHIRAAIMANVFLHARDGDQRWNGSGVVIARDGNHLAILTNRHVVESDDARRLCAMMAMTVAGEAIEVSAVWRARRGIDLALVEGRVRHPERVGVMPLGSGAVLVGAEVFAIGNPLGLAWSYTAGTLSATRHWTTRDGLSVRILQTDANIAPGSSGGGLFHRDGHLLGVMSFLRQGHAGGSAHFALSIAAIREAFAREDVRWRGQALAELSR
ncbi:MAG TPA: serine protease [Kofleriaceae bacterium]|nr:serine protease [Kofleriaceae bacterium]